MKTNFIAQGFESLFKEELPADTPKLQVDEMRKAFYAGAYHAISTITRLLDADEEPTEEDLLILDSIVEEIAEYFITLPESQS